MRLQALRPELGVSPGSSLVICHFRGHGKLILGMKPALGSRDWRQGQLGSREVGRSRVVSGHREVWVLETVQGEGRGARRVWMLGTGLPQRSLLYPPWLAYVRPHTLAGHLTHQGTVQKAPGVSGSGR